MKRKVMWCLEKICFWTGHLISIPMHWADWLGVLYKPYSWLMITSRDIDEHYSFGNWRDVTNEEDFEI